MQETLSSIMVWGIPLGAILLAFIRLFKTRLDQVEALGFSGSQLAIALSAGSLGLLVKYGDVIATTYPVVTEVAAGAAAFLVPVFVTLGFWREVTGAATWAAYSIRDKVNR